MDILVYILAAIGAIVILKFVYGFLRFIWIFCLRQTCQSKDRLYQMYGSKGKKSWAVITGGSDGIGFEMAKQLARDQGFNICIVARNKSKIDAKLEEIKKENASIETKAVVADFAKMSTIQDYREAIGTQIANLDIGLLILNAGFCEPMLFEDLRDDEIEAMVNVCAL